MMSDFLLEIYGEEIPSSAQNLIERELKIIFESFLDESNIRFKEIRSFSTSRRVTILIKSMSTKIDSKLKEIRGPRIDANKEAISGFFKSNKIKNSKKLEEREVSGKIYFIYKEKVPEKKVCGILEKKLPEILKSIKWFKSMRWGENNQRWIRPIKSILCIFDRGVIKFEFAGIKSNNFTFGNYHFSSKKIKCNGFSHYEKKLKENFVILNRSEREKKILHEIGGYCQKHKLNYELDELLLKRIADSVEYPNVFFGSFSKEYFKLPEFLLKNIISNKQDYFPLRNFDKKLSTKFCFVSNKEKKNEKLLIKGNENVLRARFSDAIFFINEDLKKRMVDRFKDLNDIVFYKDTGSLFDRAKRIDSLMKFIYKNLGENMKSLSDYFVFSNADLTSELVKEFPNLQGKVGGYYASKEGFPNEVCKALSDQYEYEFSRSYKNLLSFVLSISQKMDSIFGYFISNKKLSGAGDPYGIRRSTLSIIKICIEKKININLYDMFIFLEGLYKDQKINVEINYNFLEEFLNKRIVILFSELGFRSDITKASLLEKKTNPFLIFNRARILSEFINTNSGINFLRAFKRLDSILEKVESNIIDSNLLKEKEERKLNNILIKMQKSSQEEGSEFFFKNKILIIEITDCLNSFFDNVVVNVEDKKLKQNRHILINKFHKTIDNLYNFSVLES